MTLLYNNGKWPNNLCCPYESDEEEDEILALSEAFQKLDDYSYLLTNDKMAT